MFDLLFMLHMWLHCRRRAVITRCKEIFFDERLTKASVFYAIFLTPMQTAERRPIKSIPEV